MSSMILLVASAALGQWTGLYPRCDASAGGGGGLAGDVTGIIYFKGYDLYTDSDSDSRFEFGTDDAVSLYLNSTMVCEWNGTGFALPGDITLSAGGAILTTSNGNISLTPHGTGIVSVDSSMTVAGDMTFTAGTTFTTSSNGDLVCDAHGTGKLDIRDFIAQGDGTYSWTHAVTGAGIEGSTEIDGKLYCDGGLDINEGNITNVGDVQCDSITADAGELQFSTVSNGDLTLAPHGSGVVSVEGAELYVGDGTYSWTHSPTSGGFEGSVEIDGQLFCDGGLDLNDGNVTNVGDIQCDSLTSDAGTTGDLRFNGRIGFNAAPNASFTVTLQPLGGSGQNSINLESYGAEPNYPVYYGRRAEGTAASPTAVVADDKLVQLAGRGHDGVSFPSSSNIVMFETAAENFSATNHGTKFTFEATPIGSTTRSEIAVLAPAQLTLNAGTYLGLNATANTNHRIAILGDDAGGIGESFTNTNGGATGITNLYYQNSASPAANDIIASNVYRGKDSAGNATDYCQLNTVISTPTDASEGAYIEYKCQTIGTLYTIAKFGQVGAVRGLFLAEGEYFQNGTDGSIGLASDTGETLVVDLTGGGSNVIRFRSNTSADTFEWYNTNAGALGITSVGYQDSASPAADDVLWAMTGKGKDSGGNVTNYTSIKHLIADPTDTSEDSYVRFDVFVGGTSTTIAKLGSDGTNSGIILRNGEYINNATDTEVCIGGAENLCIDTDTGTANQIQLKSTTGVTSMVFFAGASGVDYSVVIDGETNDCTMTWMEDENQLDIGAASIAATGGDFSDGNVTNVGDIDVDSISADGSTVDYMDVNILEITQEDVGATCTLGQLRIDTGGATTELCYCKATDTWYCVQMAAGPQD